jgi:hypothetical protein
MYDDWTTCALFRKIDYKFYVDSYRFYIFYYRVYYPCKILTKFPFLIILQEFLMVAAWKIFNV